MRPISSPATAKMKSEWASGSCAFTVPSPGPRPSSPPFTKASELLASGRVEELFTYIRGIAKRPLIVVDLPPLLSTDDALIMAPKVDACLLVLAEGKSRRDSAAKALDLLSEFNLAGIVLNRSHAVVTDYYST
jgi:Mrp family chromosome partitioning ATPase